MSVHAERILHILCLICRVVTIRQMARLLRLPFGSKELRQAIQSLLDAGLIGLHEFHAAKPDVLSSYLYCHLPIFSRNEKPAFGRYAQHFQRRNAKDQRDMCCLYAKSRGAAIFGGVMPDLSKPFQVGHDLYGAEALLFEMDSQQIWQHLKKWKSFSGRYEPETYLSKTWRGEDWLKENGLSVDGYIPDIAVVDGSTIVAAIECGGRYEKDRLREVHDKCVTADPEVLYYFV